MSAKATPDQADVLAQNEQLTAQLATVTGERDTARTERDTFKSQLDEAKKGGDTLQAALSARTKERDDCRAENDTLKAENTRLKGEMADFNKRLATELSKHGIRTQAAEHKSEAPAKPLTATERCLAAKGLPADSKVTL